MLLTVADGREREFNRLRFDDGRMEKAFRRHYLRNRESMVLLGLKAAALMYVLYALIQLLQPASVLLTQTTILRSLIVMSQLIVIQLYPRAPLAHRGRLMFAVYAIFMVSIVGIEVVTRRAGVEAHYEGVMFIIFHVFLFSGMLFWRALPIALCMAALYGVGMQFSPIAAGELGFQLFFILLTAALGGGAQYLIERSSREAWLRQQQLERLATTDSVTGLANRRAFEIEMQSRLRSAANNSEGICLVLVDLDHFKRINDRLGHDAGDRALHGMGQVLFAMGEEPGDISARWGGDELIAIWNCCRAELVEQRLEKLRQRAHSVGEQLSPSGRRRKPLTTVSIGGVVVVPSQLTRLEDLLRLADEQLYEAKRSGRDCWRLAEHPTPA